MAGEPDQGVGGTREAALQLPTARLERTPLGPEGNLIGEKKNRAIVFRKFSRKLRETVVAGVGGMRGASKCFLFWRGSWL